MKVEALDAKDVAHVRGDPMDAARYYSVDFAQREWSCMWKKVWHVAGRANELAEPGDYVVHDFLNESVIVVMQDDGSLKAFFNSCRHRGQRLAWTSASTKNFTCPYHGWVYGKDGVLRDAPDPESFPQGDPCGKLALRETRVETWGGFLWYAMSDAAPSFEDYLGVIPELYRNYPMEDLVRVFQIKIDLDTNWKFAPDNFSESYHTRTAHPEVPVFCDQDYWNARSEIYPGGHGRTVQPFRPSLRDNPVADGPHAFDDVLRKWDVDPSRYLDFQTKVLEGWLDLKAAKRRLAAERGYRHYEKMDDEQITDSVHTQIFPNVTLSVTPDAIYFQRTEPHRTDPEKCTFDLWCLVWPADGQTHTDTPMVGRDILPISEAEPIRRAFDGGRGVPELEGGVVMQDLLLAEGQQRGMRSQGYDDSYLSLQETRVRHFHEVLNDYLEGRRP